MFIASPPVRSYRCPGETHDIPHGVHVARMAAGYARCRECRHGEGTEFIDAGDGASGDAEVPARRSLFQDEGVRGVYLNELTRTTASQIAGAFASCLWEEFGAAGAGESANDGLAE